MMGLRRFPDKGGPTAPLGDMSGEDRRKLSPRSGKSGVSVLFRFRSRWLKLLLLSLELPDDEGLPVIKQRSVTASARSAAVTLPSDAGLVV